MGWAVATLKDKTDAFASETFARRFFFMLIHTWLWIQTRQNKQTTGRRDIEMGSEEKEIGSKRIRDNAAGHGLAKKTR